MAINIRYGTIDEWNATPDSQKPDDDLVFLTDMPIIKTKGQTYGGNGVPTWNGESCAYADPTVLFKSIFQALKKPLYLSDTTCPKFDIYINQKWTSTGSGETRIDKWTIDDSNYHIYKMHYDTGLTEYSHYTHTGKSGYKVVFTFPVSQNSRFRIFKCADDDWLDPSGDHDKKCPLWNNDKHDFDMTYGYDFISDDEYTQQHLSQISASTKEIQTNINGTIQVIYKFGEVDNELHPKISIKLV